jgi:sialate O-acetylesterase
MKNNKVSYLPIVLLLALIISAVAAQAKVILPAVFSDNMVFQQKTNAAIWGKADAGKVITISTTWSNKHYNTTADADGNWKVPVATPKFGGPYNITISDGEVLTLKNVLIGEVWLCSGQSNMEFPVSGWSQVINYKQELADAQYPNIRLLQVEHVTSSIPLNDAKVSNGGWQPCTPQSVAGFSAVAYFFARDIYKRTGVPIGLIHSSWGGTIVEAWTSENTVKQFPDLADAYNKVKTLNPEQSREIFNRENDAWLKSIANKDAGFKQHVPVWAAPVIDTSGWKTMKLPGIWEASQMPDLDGIVWFRKTVNIPPNWAGKDVTLSLGGIDDNDITFFNGEKIGETNGYEKMRTYTIPANKIKGGQYVLAVRVFDGAGAGGIYSDKSLLYLASANGERIALDGNWQYNIALDFKYNPPPVLNDGPNRPAVLFNAMINPFIPFAIRGAIWYQGESNAIRADQYRQLFPALINDWRSNWKIKNMPFYFVQLANFMNTPALPQPSAWAELRDAQFKTLALPNTGMAVTIDIGESTDIHPKNKQEVGHRLALIALNKTYGKKNAYSGPLYTSFKVQGDKIRIKFDHTEGGLKTNDGTPVKGFEIAGADQKFYWAEAAFDGDKITVSSVNVPKPVAVRYAWADNPACNLYNAASLPASPFRTDNWVLSTTGKK